MFQIDLHEKLAGLGLTLSRAPKPVAAYVPAVRSGSLVFVSGQLPMSGGKLVAEGAVVSVVGVNALPLGASVEVELVAELLSK